jgi:hypothetical protein
MGITFNAYIACQCIVICNFTGSAADHRVHSSSGGVVFSNTGSVLSIGGRLPRPGLGFGGNHRYEVLGLFDAVPC